MESHGLVEAWRRMESRVLLVLLLALIAYWWFVLAVEAQPKDWAFDFRQFWQGGNDVAHGRSPYPSAELLATAGDHLDAAGIQEIFRFPYPAGAAVALAPLGALGFDVAAAIWGALLIAALLTSLWLLRVRDWRVLAVVVTSYPVITSVRLGTFTPLLILLLAVAWRWRERRWTPGVALAAAIAVKLFLWPAIVWLLATRRYAAAIVAAAGSAGLTLLAWAGIGFDGLAVYPELVRRLTDVVAERGFSLVALGVEAGAPFGVARVFPVVIGLGLLAGVVLAARRRDGDRLAFSLAVIAALASTPIVWHHYFTFLILVLALAWPRLSWAWGLMWIFWLVPSQQNEGDVWRLLVALAVVAVTIAWVGRRDAPVTGAAP